MTLLVGDQTDVEEEAEDPATQPVEQIEPADDAPARSADDPEFVLAAEEEVIDEEYVQDDGNDITSVLPTDGSDAASNEEHQPVEEGISALELLAETADDTVPWFEEDLTDHQHIDDESPEPDQVAVDNTVASAVEISTRTIPEDDDENDDWDAALPAEGQKGQWV